MTDNIIIRVVLTIFVCLVMIAVPTGEARDPDQIHLEWNFSGTEPIDYRIIQKLDSQIDTYSQTNQKWTKSPIHTETIDGLCTLTPLGDGNAGGRLLLKMVKIEEKGIELPLTPEQMIPQKISDFIVTATGGFESYEGGTKETYLIVRLLFGFPQSSVYFKKIKIFPFRLYLNKEFDAADLAGTISHQLKGFETINGEKCARIDSEIDLYTTPDSNSIEGKIEWKGTGTLYFSRSNMRVEKESWKIAKKTETAVGDEKIPTRIVEVFNLDVNRFRK